QPRPGTHARARAVRHDRGGARSRRGAAAAHRLAALGCLAAYPFIAQLLTLPLDGEDARQVTSLAPDELQRLTFGAVADLLGRLAVDAPLAVELDDLHWADPSSVDLLLKLLELADRAPILICCALRPE